VSYSGSTENLAETLLRDGFIKCGDTLAIGGVPVCELAETYGTPLYVYDADRMRRNYSRLCEALAGFAEVFYSIKANPHPAVSRVFVEQGAGVEIASGAELLLAQAAGCTPGRIVFAGPGKGEEELAVAVESGIGELHVESFEEIARLGRISQRTGGSIRVAIRVNPGAEALGGAMRMGGSPAPFGFDEEALDDVLEALTAHPSLDLCGIHLFCGTQILNAEVLLKQWKHGLDLASCLGRRIGRPLRSVDLGGGLGIPYHDGDRPLDLDQLKRGVSQLAESVAGDPFLREATIVVEPGRFLVGPAGVYLMEVQAVKMSRGKRFVVTNGGMHHHLAASGNLGQVIKRDYPIVAATRLGDSCLSQATIVGPLCTPLDTLGRQHAMPVLKEGDLLAVLQSGAYGLSASPTGFLSHPMPAEVLISAGRHQAIRTRGTIAASVHLAMGSESRKVSGAQRRRCIPVAGPE